MKSLVYDYRDKKEQEIKELNETYESFKNEIETNHNKSKKNLTDEND